MEYGLSNTNGSEFEDDDDDMISVALQNQSKTIVQNA